MEFLRSVGEAVEAAARASLLGHRPMWIVESRSEPVMYAVVSAEERLATGADGRLRYKVEVTVAH